MKRWMTVLPAFVAAGALCFLSSCGRESPQTEVQISYGAQYAISRVDPATHNIQAQLFLTASNELQATMEHDFAAGTWKFIYASKPDKPLTLTNEHFPEATVESLADVVKQVWDQDPMQGHGSYCSGCCGICFAELCLEWWCSPWNLGQCSCIPTGATCFDTYCCSGNCGGGT
jgi:hypothetical protein